MGRESTPSGRALLVLVCALLAWSAGRQIQLRGRTYPRGSSFFPRSPVSSVGPSLWGHPRSFRAAPLGRLNRSASAMSDFSANSQVPSRLRALPWIAFTALLGACSGAGAADPAVSPSDVGNPAELPDGSGLSFITDPHFGGQGDAIFIEELFWGRLVDVFDEDPATGESNLVYRDLVVGDSVLTQFGTWRLEAEPLSGRTNLIIERANTESPNDEFDQLVSQAESAVGPIIVNGTGLNESPPFSFVARNGALVVRFSDLIDPETISLNDSFRVQVGNPPETDFDARLLPSPSHGGLASGSGEFFSTRVIVDFTVDSGELALLDDALALNGVGLPATVDPLQANVAIELPTQTDPGGGSFDLLRNPRGRTVSFQDNGPIDPLSPTNNVVRAMRSGFDQDPENGFLADNFPPSLIGSQGLVLTSAIADPAGQPGVDFIVNFTFDTPECAMPPDVGDVVMVGSIPFAVTQIASVSQGFVSGLRIQLPVGFDPIESASFMLGQGTFRTAWRDGLPASLAPCFFRFTPESTSPPSAGVQPGAQVIVEFSEPMDPTSVRPFDTFVASTTADVQQVSQFVVSSVIPSADLQSFRLVPTVGFNHVLDLAAPQAEQFFIELSSDPESLVGLTDLAGNSLAATPPQFPLAMDPLAQSNEVGGFALPFNSTDEFVPNVGPGQNGNDLAGQVFYDLPVGEIFPRPVSRFPAIVDRNSVLVSVMQPVASGLQTPLSNLGSRLHIMWRYSDVGYPISYSDGTFVNLDVEGISLAPLGGSVTSTFYPQFEMTLGHSGRLHDEFLDPDFIVPDFPQSGFMEDAPFSENFLADPDNPPLLVHEREQGFFVAQTGVFSSETGTSMLRFPMNVDAPPGEEITYVWRDTAIEMRGGINAEGNMADVPGIPHAQEQEIVFGNVVPLGEDAFILDYLYEAGAQVPPIGNPAGVPSIGLPLLMEFSCFPSDAVSLNNFDASITNTTSRFPLSRAFSTGGFNTSDAPVIKNPDNEPVPTGGFNGIPPVMGAGPALGAMTPPQDPTVYLGQMDIVVRVSRVYTTLISAGAGSAPDYAALVQEPNPVDQPTGTRIEFAFRGDEGNPAAAYFDAADLDLYGNSITETSGPTGELSLAVPEWSDSIDSIDGLEWSQIRMSFIGNTQSMLTPRLSAIGVAFRN